MFVSDKNTVIFLGIVFIINGEHWNVPALLKNGELPLLVNQRYAANHNMKGQNKLTPAVQITHKNVFETTEQQNSNAIDDLIKNSLKTFNNLTRHTEVPKTAETNLVNNITRKLQSKKRLIQKRCPLTWPRYSKQINPKQRSRSRFLEVFQIVQFEHVACTSSNGLDGTCLHDYECQSSGGTDMGDCADGYGTCCVTLFPCDGTSAASMGWFNNPDFPSPTSERLSCTLTLEKASEDIKQLRLDFAIFELLQPTGGICQQDQFVVSGQNINDVVPILCGINTGQHVYIEVGDVEGPIYFAVQTVSSDSRLFSIKVTQLASTDELAAPSGCLQYFKGPQGYIESFNYRDKSDIGIARVPSYLNNLNYAMCIAREPQSCSVTYTNEDEMQIFNYDLDGIPVIPPNQAGVEIFNCPSDWLLIAAIRLCGERLNDGSVIQDFSLNAPITDTNAGPIVVWFRSDEGYVGRGFKLQYQQYSCLKPTTK